MKHLKLFEEFEEVGKPSFFQRAVKGTKSFLGIESKEDRKTLDNIHRIIDEDRIKVRTGEQGFVSNIREIKPGVIVCSIASNSLTVDTIDNEILYKGKELQLNDTQMECDKLYHSLNRFLPKPKYDISFNYKRKRDIDPNDPVLGYQSGDEG